MQRAAFFFTSSIGKKVIMAVTGLVLFGFVVGHLLGNLQVFLGQDVMNDYAATLHEMPGLVWTARIGLLAMVGLHIWAAVQLTVENRRARPEPYSQKGTQATYASRTMRWSGFIILGFVIYHLLHFTVLVIHPEYRDMVDAEGRHDVFGMVVAGFENWFVSGFYILSMALLGLHLSHGLTSMMQTLGLRNSATRQWMDFCSWAIAVVIFVGYITIPVAVLVGIVAMPETAN